VIDPLAFAQLAMRSPAAQCARNGINLWLTNPGAVLFMFLVTLRSVGDQNRCDYCVVSMEASHGGSGIFGQYPLTLTDAAIASEILTLLHDVYDYAGATKLKIDRMIWRSSSG
jgi:hypothetical protein